MSKNISKGQKVFNLLNYAILLSTALLCLLPMIHVLALSFSSSIAASAGQVAFWPVGFNLNSYKFAFSKPEFMRSFIVSVERLVLGTVINMFFTIIAAYPLSKEKSEFPMRTFYTWFFFLTMLFSGGLIPYYMTVRAAGLLNTIWVLIIPGAVPVFNVIILLNFFRGLPKEMIEAAYVDGATHWTVLWRIMVPLSKPALATLILFVTVGHWNQWFDGILFLNSPEKYPMMSYLQTIVVSKDLATLSNATKEQLEVLQSISDRTSKAAQIFIAAFPILIIYPFLQKYFTKGLVMGSVKG